MLERIKQKDFTGITGFCPGRKFIGLAHRPEKDSERSHDSFVPGSENGCREQACLEYWSPLADFHLSRAAYGIISSG
ncbi:MAG: hypothetical protein MZV63_47060 [Marinilabiliales bacterium]|nr:hypothetical protein [Marinilabiliales bacterium]